MVYPRAWCRFPVRVWGEPAGMSERVRIRCPAGFCHRILGRLTEERPGAPLSPARDEGGAPKLERPPVRRQEAARSTPRVPREVYPPQGHVSPAVGRIL